MRRTIDASPLPLLPGITNIFHLLLLLVACVAPAASGQETALISAILRYDPSPTRISILADCDSAANSFGCVSVPHLQSGMAALQSISPGMVTFSLGCRLDAQNGFYWRAGLQLAHKKSADGGTDFWGHIEAGYGQFCRLESSFGKSVMELEQPSCAYLKASFSF